MSVQDEVRQYLRTQLPEFEAHIQIIKPGTDANAAALVIIALIQKCIDANLIKNGHEVITVVDVLLKLDHVDFDIAIYAMTEAAKVPIIVGASPTAVKIAWWRNVITLLFAGGLTIAAINAIVPIPFAFIVTTILAGGKAVATAVATAVVGLLSPVDIGNAAAQAAAQAAPGAANMVAGPSMDALKSLGGYFYLAAATVLGSLAAAAVQVCTGAARACTMPNSEKIADAAFLTFITKGMQKGGDKLLDFLTIFYRGGYDEYFANIIDNGGLLDLPINELINTVLASAEDVNNAQIKVKWFDEGKALYDRDLDPKINVMINEYLNAKIESFDAPKKLKVLERLSILLDLSPNISAMDRLILDPEDRELAVLYTLKYIKSPKFREGYGKNSNLKKEPTSWSQSEHQKPQGIIRSNSADGRFSNVEDTTRLHPTADIEFEFDDNMARNAPKLNLELLILYTGDVDFYTIIKDNRNLKIAIMKSKDQDKIYNAIKNAPTRMGRNHPINQYNYIEAIMDVLPEEETLELKTEVDEHLKTIYNSMDDNTKQQFDRDRDRDSDRDRDRRGGGRRRSRRYKKRRSTLKRRRIRRRRTRKGKKRRHTRRH